MTPILRVFFLQCNKLKTVKDEDSFRGLYVCISLPCSAAVSSHYYRCNQPSGVGNPLRLLSKLTKSPFGTQMFEATPATIGERSQSDCFKCQSHLYRMYPYPNSNLFIVIYFRWMTASWFRSPHAASMILLFGFHYLPLLVSSIMFLSFHVIRFKQDSVIVRVFHIPVMCLLQWYSLIW